MNKKAIVFDMGGVLVDLDLEGSRAYFKDVLEYYDIDKILDPCHQKGIYGDMEEGKISAEEFTRIVLASSKPDATQEDVVQAVWKILLDIAPYKVDLLRKMAAKYDLYMLSNINSIAIRKVEEIFSNAGIPLDSIFRKRFYSYELKTIKPSAYFYRTVMEEISLPAEDMLFIDDSRANVEGAVNAGLPAVHYEPGSDLAGLLAEILEDESLRRNSSEEVRG